MVIKLLNSFPESSSTLNGKALCINIGVFCWALLFNNGCNMYIEDHLHFNEKQDVVGLQKIDENIVYG